jgi:hypothetical protein
LKKSLFSLFFTASVTAVAVVFLSRVMADGQDFTVSIVGQEQSNISQYKREGLPIVFCGHTSRNKNEGLGWVMDQPSADCFFVIVQNVQKVPYAMTLGASEWWVCLQFTIETGSNKTYSAFRRQIAWSANPRLTWTFPIGGMRVLPVDFTCGYWAGLPPTPSEPELATMTAAFRYYDAAAGKEISVASKPTDVYLCPRR